ncbi:hypothetical protein MKX01_016596, partial [Papaver californicum]
SNLLRLTMSSDYQFHSWFTYLMLLLFLSTAGFWMTRLNEGLALFDAILIVPMFQIAWTFFSICTGFVYFQEYQVFDALRTTMFILGMSSVFVGISLLAPDESKGGESKESTSLMSSTSPNITSNTDRLDKLPTIESDIEDMRSSFVQAMIKRVSAIVVKAKSTCSLSLGLGEDTIGASSVFVMPMVSSRMTGFRGNGLIRGKFSPRHPGWTKISIDDTDAEMLETSAMLSQNRD